MSYGLLRTFVIDKNMTIKTLSVKIDEDAIMLRASIFRLLIWLQRTVLTQKGHYTFKAKLEQSITFTHDTNMKLINYYLTYKNMPYNIEPKIGKYNMGDVLGNNIYVLKQTSDVYMLMVMISHDRHKDLVPMLSLYDP